MSQKWHMEINPLPSHDKRYKALTSTTQLNSGLLSDVPSQQDMRDSFQSEVGPWALVIPDSSKSRSTLLRFCSCLINLGFSMKNRLSSFAVLLVLRVVVDMELILLHSEWSKSGLCCSALTSFTNQKHSSPKTTEGKNPQGFYQNQTHLWIFQTVIEKVSYTRWAESGSRCWASHWWAGRGSGCSQWLSCEGAGSPRWCHPRGKPWRKENVCSLFWNKVQQNAQN